MMYRTSGSGSDFRAMSLYSQCYDLRSEYDVNYFSIYVLEKFLNATIFHGTVSRNNITQFPIRLVVKTFNCV